MTIDVHGFKRGVLSLPATQLIPITNHVRVNFSANPGMTLRRLASGSSVVYVACECVPGEIKALITRARMPKQKG